MMMDHMMGGGMMWGMGLIGLLVIIVLILAAAALVKYLFLAKPTAVRSISEQIQLVSYLRSNAFVGVVGKRLIQW